MLGSCRVWKDLAGRDGVELSQGHDVLATDQGTYEELFRLLLELGMRL